MTRSPKAGGRKKVQLQRIENEEERAATFTKLSGEIFKEAHELATLHGVEIAIIINSLSGEPITFGSPNLAAVLSKFHNGHQAEQHPDDSVTNNI